MESRRDVQVFRAMIALEAERYDELFSLITAVAKDPVSIEPAERNLVNKAFRNALTSRRHSIQRINKYINLKKENHTNTLQFDKEAKIYLKRLEHELETLCITITELLEMNILRKEASDEGFIFFSKLAGDYYRYMAEVLQSEAKRRCLGRAKMYYESALQKSLKFLEPDNPTRLSVFLNFSVFLYENLKDQEKALVLCKYALQQGIKAIEVSCKEPREDTQRILQLIRDNATLWIIVDEEKQNS